MIQIVQFEAKNNTTKNSVFQTNNTLSSVVSRKHLRNWMGSAENFDQTDPQKELYFNINIIHLT